MDRVVFILLAIIIPIVTLGQQIHCDSTFTSNGQKFHVQLVQLEKYMTLLKVRKGQHVISTDTLDFTNQLELLDFNGDTGIDIMINFIGNVNHQSLFLLDKSKNRFKKVKDFEKYPGARKVRGSNFYYSYYRSGCADNYWASDLFKIVDFKIVHLGQIFGQGCEEPMQIKIYKVQDGKKELTETLPYKLVTDKRNDKFGFIEEYWTKHQDAYR